MYSLVQKNIQLKPMASAHKLMGLIIEILGENTEVVLAECLKGFGPCRVDGNDALAVYTAISAAREMVVNEQRPILIEWIWMKLLTGDGWCGWRFRPRVMERMKLQPIHLRSIASPTAIAI
ncbi:hypothetical protein F3Y22_tig00111584pilonHSYRG00201 [Hibiscus syriacus]|uniref:Dehydrogenase E1 component domain-containing protein n=1 Tax=Hibiscus syriacus TaxID=106335 RepID=A0A6A2XM52_HIBSY|nr:hypothetical protein F3Y22_tig00111584pilonHSYRG00201 [Hibiscus syriacus]